jgi:predicted transcriptional regulator of viral defense system
MKQVDALKRLESLGHQGFETRDAAALLGVTPGNASKILQRLAQGGFLVHVARGHWLLSRNINRNVLPELIALPYPAYISLQSALFLHGLIEQIPVVTYAITLGKPRRVRTSLGTVSFHRIPPELFTGFEIGKDGVKTATPEKALFDTLYLAPGRSRLFAALPELEVPRGFRWKRVRDYVNLVKSPGRRTFLTERISRLKRDGAI